MTHIPSYDMDGVFAEIEKFTRLQREYKEQTLAEIITKYDFIVGSKECKFRLMEILPEGANIICSPYIESPTTIYAIKKFDAMDLLIGTQESEQESKTGHWIIYDVHGHKACKCSECDKDVGYPCNDKYCPKCGAKMSESGE